ncbi:hypothetical protein DENSPDRAFT_893395 [Dentipellis sp. KUC8613]|nr:hypothetical protein DENSPDRAFT_893395 [Dentipellis sp. KUC8613]
MVITAVRRGRARPRRACRAAPPTRLDTRRPNKIQKRAWRLPNLATTSVPFGVTYEKIGTIQRRLAWPLHKDDTLSQSGRPTGLNIYFLLHLSRTVHTLRR